VVELHRRVSTSSLDLARGVVHTQASSVQDEESSLVFRGGSRGVLQRFVGHRSSSLTFCDGAFWRAPSQCRGGVAWSILTGNIFFFLVALSLLDKVAPSHLVFIWARAGYILILSGMEYHVPPSQW
ncbi:unnamed protein product, partial [Brassica rapa subsp. trilocularis]